MFTDTNEYLPQSNEKQSHAVESDKKSFSILQNIFNQRSFFPQEAIKLCFSETKKFKIDHFGLAAVKFVLVGGGQNFKFLNGPENTVLLTSTQATTKGTAQCTAPHLPVASQAEQTN